MGKFYPQGNAGGNRSGQSSILEVSRAELAVYSGEADPKDNFEIFFVFLLISPQYPLYFECQFDLSKKGAPGTSEKPPDQRPREPARAKTGEDRRRAERRRPEGGARAETVEPRVGRPAARRRLTEYSRRARGSCFERVPVPCLRFEVPMIRWRMMMNYRWTQFCARSQKTGDYPLSESEWGQGPMTKSEAIAAARKILTNNLEISTVWARSVVDGHYKTLAVVSR